MAELKEKVLEERKKVKALKLKSKAFGEKLDNEHDIYEEVKQWEKDRDGILGRKDKLNEKIQTTINNGKRLGEKLEEMEQKYEGVEEYMKEWEVRR